MAGKRKRSGQEVPNTGSAPQKKVRNGASATKSVSKPNLEKKPFVESPLGEERRREASLYELLGSEEESDRIAAADCIISSLFGESPVPEAVLVRHLDRRLFRGLASGRNASRLGFSLVITEILSQLFGKDDLATSQYPYLSFETVFEFLKDKTHPEGNIPGQEERDHYFGQLFGIECFVRSDILFEQTSRWDMVLNALLHLSSKKVWLRSQCGWIIVQALDHMKQTVVESTLQKTSYTGMAKTPEGVAIWLTALDKFPDIKVKPWGRPLSPKSFGELATVLKENFNEKGNNELPDQNNKQASWTAQLPFVWNMLLSHYAEEKISADDLEQFWSRVVDDSFFSKNATDSQKFKGFMVFQLFLEGLEAQKAKIGALFSKNMMACLMNQAAKQDRYLHRAATKALKAIESKADTFPTMLPIVLSELLGKHGAHNFDQRTSTKTIEKLLQQVSQANEKKVLDILRQLLAMLDKDETQSKSILRSYVDYLGKALSAIMSPQSSDTKEATATPSYTLFLNELSRIAYSQPSDIPQTLLTDQIREMCRSRLESSLAKLTRNANDLSTFCNAIGSIDPSSVPMEDDIKTATEEALSRMHKLLKRKAKTDADRGLNQGLATLHAVSIFQLYNEDPNAMEALNDLAQYDTKLKKGETGAGSSELLVEILLSMVAQPSSLMRQVSQQVFESFTSQITSGALELLTDPLASGESVKGQKQLFNTDEDAMAVDDDDDESSNDDENEAENGVIDIEDASDIDIDSDIEFVTLGENDDESDGDDEKGEDEDDDEDDEDEDEDANDSTGGSDSNDDEKPDEKPDDQNERIELDDVMSNILRSHRLDKDMDAISSASDGDMSDSEMLALDEKLSEVFKQRSKSRPDTKKQKKDAKQSVVNFKHRILDLLDIYVKNEALNPITFSVLGPLLHLMRTTNTKALGSRACETILNFQRGLKKLRSNKDKVSKDEETTQDTDLLALLVEIHDAAGQDNAHSYAKASSAASLIVASAMFATDKASIKQVAAVYANTQCQWVLGEIQLQNSFFADWNNWCQNHASQAQSSS